MGDLVIVTERLHASAVEWLEERCSVLRVSPQGAGFRESIGRAAGLVVRTYTRVDAALLDGAPLLRVVGRAGVGLDNIDLRACAERGIVVVYTPDANTGAVVEYVFALLFDALRPRMLLAEPVSAAEWNELRRTHVAEWQLSDRTLGVYGFGRVGSAVARAARGFGMRVLYHDLVEIPEPARSGAQPVSRDELLASSDIVTVHVDGRAENRSLIGAVELARMKRDAVLVNTSRGFVIDAAALADWLRERPAALALLDVHEPEPFGADHPLLSLPNARLLPHLGAATATADLRMSMVVRDVWRVLSGEQALHAAEPPRGPPTEDVRE